MIRTFTRTTFVKDLTQATIKIDVYDANKYTGKVTERVTVKYTGVKSWSIIEGGAEAEEIEAHTDASGVDDNHEYLVLNFADGKTATFRNSHVDLHIR